MYKKKNEDTNLSSQGARLFPFFSWLTPLGIPYTFKDCVLVKYNNRVFTHEVKTITWIDQQRKSYHYKV
jgi:hypothetical protein